MRILLRNLGYLLVISSFFRVIPIVAALIFNESYRGFLLTFGISFVLGLLLVLFTRSKTDETKKVLTLTEGLLLGALAFILLPLIGMITYLPSLDYNYLNAYLESISGFTTTGITVYDSLSGLPKSLLLWRAETQWMGGIGIIIVFLFLFSKRRGGQKRASDLEAQNESSMALYQAQGFKEKMEGGLRNTLAIIMGIYLGYTLLGIILLWLAGMPLFDSISMSFSALSTGGFSVTDGFYTNGWQLLVLDFMMILGAISFITHNKLLQMKWGEFYRSFEKNVFLIFIFAGAAISMLVMTDVKIVFFEIINAFSTTGFSASAISTLPQLFLVILMLGMIVGGSSASTAGGVKVFRFYYLFRAIPWHIKKLSSPPSAVIPLNIHGEETTEKDLSNIAIFVISYFLVLFIGILFFMLYGFDFFDSAFQLISNLGNIGLQTVDIATLPALLKIILIVAMLFGRLEIFPILILIRQASRRLY